MSLNYNHLLYFYTTVNSGSLKQAAQTLSLSPSTVSEQIGELEEYFGKTLLRRQKGKIALTDHGQTAYHYARTIFTAGERLRQTLLGAPKPEMHGNPIEIGVNNTVTSLFERDLFLPLFKDEETKISLRIGELSSLTDDLFGFSLDILLTDREIREGKGVKREVIQHPSYSVVCSPKLKPKGFKFPQDLSRLPFIHYTVYAGIRWEIDQFFLKNGVKPELIGEVDDTGLMTTVANDALCFAILPTALVHRQLQRGELISLGMLTDIDAKIYAYYHEREPTKQIRAVIEFLKTVKA